MATNDTPIATALRKVDLFFRAVMVVSEFFDKDYDGVIYVYYRGRYHAYVAWKDVDGYLNQTIRNDPERRCGILFRHPKYEVT